MCSRSDLKSNQSVLQSRKNMFTVSDDFQHYFITIFHNRAYSIFAMSVFIK